MSGVFSTYLSGIRLLFLEWKAWVVVFMANIIFALLIALPFERLLSSFAEHSESPLEGLQRFDIDFIGDVINNYGGQLHLLIGQVVLLAGLYLILNIFLSGGLIEGYVHLFSRFSLSDFLSNCAKHFWRLFRVALYFIGVQIFVVGALGTIYVKLGLSPFDLESDSELINRSRIMLIIFVLIFGWIDMVHEYVKVSVVVQKEKGFILPLLIKVKYLVLRHFFPMLILFLLCVMTFLILLCTYSLLNDVFNMQSLSTIIVAFLVGQVYLFFRIGSRLLFTSTATDYLRSKNWGI